MSSSETASEEKKIPLAQFLKIITNGNVPMAKAMALAGKIYKTNCTPSRLRDLNEFTLKDCGVTDQSERKLVLGAVRKAGYRPVPRTPVRRVNNAEAGPSTLPGPSPRSVSPTRKRKVEDRGPLSSVEAVFTPFKRKRSRVQEKNEFLPEGPDGGVDIGNLDFNEVLDEKELRLKFVIINRAPVMTAWTMVVAECMNFSREEALSIASVFAEMNALSRGTSLGIYNPDEVPGVKSGGQPYVDIMGRRIPLYQTQEGTWRALSNGSPVPPVTAFAYICRSFRQTTPFVVGAMRLLAESWCSPPRSEPVSSGSTSTSSAGPNAEALNKRAYGFYCDFRPEVEEWGKRSEMSCAKILGLRRVVVGKPTLVVGPAVPISAPRVVVEINEPAQSGNLGGAEETSQTGDSGKEEKAVVNADIPIGVETPGNPIGDTPKPMTLEEYEATLDEDHAFDNIDF